MRDGAEALWEFKLIAIQKEKVESLETLCLESSVDKVHGIISRELH